MGNVFSEPWPHSEKEDKCAKEVMCLLLDTSAKKEEGTQGQRKLKEEKESSEWVLKIINQEPMNQGTLF